jgi:hypothetical protein
MPTTSSASAYPASCWQHNANDPQELHGGMLACILDALSNGTPEARKMAAEITGGRLVIAWTCPDLPWHPLAGVERLALLTDALGAQAFAYAADGLQISAGDCYWLIAKLTGGALQITTAKQFATASDAEAARRRGHDLDRWQREAEARAYPR